MNLFESQSKAIAASPLAALILTPGLAKALSQTSSAPTSFSSLRDLVEQVQKSAIWVAAQAVATAKHVSPSASVSLPSGPPPTLDVDWISIGMYSALRQIFAVAVVTAFPQMAGTPDGEASVTKCGNPAMGHYQCNNAMGIAKLLKSVTDYTGNLYCTTL